MLVPITKKLYQILFYGELIDFSSLMSAIFQ